MPLTYQNRDLTNKQNKTKKQNKNKKENFHTWLPLRSSDARLLFCAVNKVQLRLPVILLSRKLRRLIERGMLVGISIVIPTFLCLWFAVEVYVCFFVRGLRLKQERRRKKRDRGGKDANPCWAHVLSADCPSTAG